MRVALAILLLLHGSSALAQADAGPVTDAAAVDPRTKVDSALRAEIESLQSDREAVDASGLEDFDSEIVRRRHGVELRSPGAALALLATLEARLPELQQRADDRDALYQLAAEADKRKPKRRRTALDAARLATMALEAQLSRAQLEMTRATIAYLSSTQAARRTASETAEARLRAAQRELAEKREAARRAEEQARAEAASAITAAEKLLSASRAELEGVHKKQIDLRRQLLADRQRLQAQIQSQKTDRARLEAELANFAAKVNSDRAFAHIAADLDVAEATAISLLYQQLINQPLAVPEPPDSLQAPVLELENSFQARVQALLERRTALAAEADLLRKERRALRADQAAEWRAHALGLARLRDRALRRISPALASEIYGLNRSSLAEVQAEGAELAIRGLHYLGRRSAQLKRASGSLRTLRAIASLAVSSIELLLFVGLVWWAMRRWKGWMRGVVSAMSRYVHLGGWPLIFARVADALQTCGPPLILAAASVAVYQFLGATESPAEIRVGFEIVFWTALLRGQLRFLEGFADNVSARREQAARDRREEAALDDSVESNDRLPKHEREDYNRAAKLFKRSWKVLTWFVGLFVITIELVQLSMGDGVVAHHLFFFAKVLAIPVLIITVHWWRAMIVTAYAHRIDARSKFASFVIKHGSRWYGAVVALVAMPVLLATRGTRLVREHVAGLNTTRRILAFLFRRQIERHAEKSGKSESIVVELPDKLVELFPHDSLAAETAPLRPPTVDEVETKINAWLDSPVDGSAALVGGAGMGKTTILNFLSAELEVEVNTIDIDRKVVKTADLWTTLADKLDLPADTKSEEAAISAIKERYSKAIVAVDNAHNLFLRRVGGFEAWRGLTRLVNATCNDVFWILALNDVAWGYLLALDGGVSPFRSVLVIHGLTEDSLRKVMMSRMRTGRFRTSFSDLLISDQPGMRRSTQIIRTSRGYFSMLWDYTQGNPRLANHFWLKSLAVDDKTARVRLFSTPPIDELEALRDEAAFTLAALVEHENLNATELSLITNLPKDRARFLLQLCHDKGILKSPEVGRFEVSTHWQVAVYRYLRRKNLLYA